jgi:glutathione S-transferase/GST-like protein
MYRLYGAKGSGSLAVEALLEELGLACETVRLETDAGAHLQADYLRIDPYGRVPALELPDGSVLTESAAILLHLCDCHPAAGLLPEPGTPSRAQAYRWLLFLAAEVYQSHLRYYHAERYTTDPTGEPAVRTAAVQGLDAQLALIGGILAPFVLGERFSAVDPYLAMLVQWQPHRNDLLGRVPALQRHRDLVLARPATARAWQRHHPAA